MNTREFSGRMALAASKYGKERDYWLEQLSGKPVKTVFPYDRVNKTAYPLEVNRFRLESTLSQRLREIAKTSDYTLHMILVTGLVALLGKYTGSKDIIVGMPIYSQDGEEEFLNTALALRNQLEDHMSFRELLFQVRQTIIEANRHRNYPLEILLSHLNMPFSRNNFPLFEVVLLLENIQQKKYLEHTSPNVIFSFLNTPDSIEAKMEYNAALYHRETAARIATHFKRLLEGAVFNVDVPVLEIQLMSAGEKRQVLWEFNQTKTPYPGDKTIDELFREQAGQVPFKVAVSHEQEFLTYDALAERAHRLAVFLQNKGLRPEEAVGIMVENNVKTLVGILGILNAGGAYLPLNAQYPGQRQKYLLEEGGVRWLLLTGTEACTGVGDETHGVEILHPEPFDRYPGQGSPGRNHFSGSLAYIIYTSGSSGEPKGVLVTHRSVVRLVKNTDYVEFREKDRLLPTGALDFDASTFEIWGALLNGLQLVLAHKGTILNPGALKGIIRKNVITTLWMTSSLFNQMVDEDVTIFEGLGNLLVGGEVLSPVHINRVRQAFPELKITNGYGPTENTTFSVTHLIRQEYEQRIPIGKPIANSTAYIIDGQNHPVPIGVPGELYVGGDGLARGYLNNPELTSEKFLMIRSDWSDWSDKYSRSYWSSRTYIKIYKTGDLARWLPQGDIEFLGRLDDQVKIRGFRIEPGEIETHLANAGHIREAVVAVRERQGEKYLCAYVVAQEAGALNTAELKKNLAQTLPAYMIPSYFVQIEKIPLTPNGKVNRNALPEPGLEAGTHDVAPRTKLEKQLAEIWSGVLGVKKEILGIDANFFDLGGHSLKATLLTARIHKELKVKIPLAELFKTPTIREIGAYIQGLAEEKFISIEAAEAKEYDELSSAQKRLYLLQQMQPDSTGYNIPLVVALVGELDREKLEKTFRELIKRHESLRTSFRLVKEIPVQRIHREAALEIEIYLAGDEARTHHLSFIIHRFIRPYDFSQAPLMRVGLIKDQDNRHILMIDIHHIITDGTSMGILVNEFMRLYAREDLPRTRLRYRDFSKWQNRSFASAKIKSRQEYWMRQFQGDIPLLDLPTDYPRPLEQSVEGDVIDFEIHSEQTGPLKEWIIAAGMTPFIFLLALYTIFLSKISRQEDIVIGTPIAGRGHAGLEQIVGMFVNTLALRNHPAGEKTAGEFLKEVKANAIRAFDNQEYQFEELVEQVEVKRDVGRNPLFDVMLSFHNENDPQEIREVEIPGLKLKSYPYRSRVSRFDLVLVGEERDDGLALTFSYCVKLFKRETVQRFVGYFKRILAEVVENPGVKISEIEVIPVEEKNKILYYFNDTAARYPGDKTLHDLFAEQVTKNPDHTALVGQIPAVPFGPNSYAFGTHHLSYRELEQRAAQVAETLREKGIRSDTIVGIMAQRSAEMIIGILGILKAGGAYLPLDPDYPEERKQYMLKDSGAKILLTRREIAGLSSPEAFNTGPKGTPSFGISPRQGGHLAYVIYTSGTTGKPKGALVNHGNVVGLLFNDKTPFDFSEADVWTLFHSSCFDFSVWEMYGALLYGGKLIVISQMTARDPQRFLEVLEKEKVTILNQTPQAFYHLAHLEIQDPGKTLGLRFVIFGGDVLKPAQLKSWREKYPRTTLVNMFGITETTVHVTYKEVEPGDIAADISNIGRPLATLTVYIMDRDRKLVPMGTAGEICVGGAGLCRGYLNRPELTREKFVDNPYFKGKLLYRSGDAGKILESGDIEYLGRIDQQVKIRGFRIEPGEIETHLANTARIQEAVVAVKERQGDTYLCAYVVAKEAGALNTADLKKTLSQTLPAYMIPSYFVQIEKIPLTPNGKVDRNALPEPGPEAGEHDIAPRDKLEKQLAEIWSGVLGVKKEIIGIDANFFELGGHSLKATLLTVRIHKELKVKIPLVEFFKTPTIRDIAAYIQGSVEEKFISIEAAEAKEYYELSSAQKRLYLLQQMQPDSTGYNIPLVVTLVGELDRQKLEKTFRELIERHESLRTSFQLVKEIPVQEIHGAVEFEIGFYEAREEKNPKLQIPNQKETGTGHSSFSNLHFFIRPFDLSQAPLMRVGLLKQQDKRHILMIDIHHIITDGTSMGILVNQFMRLYAREDLPRTRLRYRDFSKWQNRLFASAAIKSQQEYWKSQFQGTLPLLDLPTDYPRPVEQSVEGDAIDFEIHSEQTGRLKEWVLETGMTPFIFLLALYTIFLSKISRQEDIVIGTPIAGRGHAGLEKIVGMFVNTLALRNNPAGEKTAGEFLKEVKANALRAFDNQEFQFEELVEQVEIKRDVGRNPLFDVMLSFHDETDPPGIREVETPGLKLEPYPYRAKISKFDLVLVGAELDNRLAVTFSYCVKLFKRETVQRFVNYFKRILTQVVENPGVKIAEIEVLGVEEKNKLLYHFNDTAARYPGEKTIDELFREQAGQAPFKVAVSHEQEFLTYDALAERAHRLAVFLQNKGLRPEEAVGIMAENNVKTLVGILGILNAGGAYLPLNAQYPGERQKYLLEEGGVRMLLLTGTEACTGVGNETHGVEILHPEPFDRYPGQGSPRRNHFSASLAYIIYTSGSSGQPKGVLVTHRSVVRLVKNTDYVEFREKDSILPTGALDFDASTFEIWGALLNGLQLVLAHKGAILNPGTLKGIIRKNVITTLWMTSSLFNQMLDEDITIFKGLGNLLVGGEVLSPAHINRVRQAFPGLKVINGYGPTENTTFSVTHLIRQEYEQRIPIGKPIANSTAYIIDGHNHPVPIAVPGELCVGGDGLARGYLNNPELTSEKFLMIRFDWSDLSDKYSRSYWSYRTYIKIYKTGDLARWLPQGDIEFLGRLDDQVKIRGFRIEPGEIESHLANAGHVREAVVAVRERQGEKYLCAYVVSKEAGALHTAELKKNVSQTLPAYMIPSYFIQIEKIPLTPNGKVDRNALPEPGLEAGEHDIAPRDKLEKQLAEIWSEVLGVKKEIIGIDANFFDLGGHSLKATSLTARIHKELEVKIPLAELFKTPTIREIAAYIRGAAPEKFTSIEAAEAKEYYELSSAQKRLYLLQRMQPDSTGYHIPLAAALVGELDRQKLEKTFRKLIERHESLRTSFQWVKEIPVQMIHGTVELAIEFYEVREEKNPTLQIPNQKETGSHHSSFSNHHFFIRPFDLSRAPLVRVGLIKQQDNRHILMIDIHHIITDGTSMGILVNQFMKLYAKENLPRTRLRYRDFSKWQNRLLTSTKIKSQQEYWRTQFQGTLPLLDLPTDYPRPLEQSVEGDAIDFEINREQTGRIKEWIIEAGMTPFIFLLALYTIFLSKISRQEDIIIGTPIAGRGHAGLEQIVGMFVNTLVIRNNPAGEKTAAEFLEEVKTNALRAFDNQEFQFEELVEQVEVKRDVGRNPLFDVMFSFHNEIDPQEIREMEIPGLKLESHPYRAKTSRFDLVLAGVELDDRLAVTFSYGTKLFKRETVQRFVNYFQRILAGVVENPGVKISEIEVIPVEEKNKLLYHFNETAARYPVDKTLHDLFVEQVSKAPDHTALVGHTSNPESQIPNREVAIGPISYASGIHHLSYRELEQRAAQVAETLREKGIRADSIVGIMVRRSAEMIIGILGILKAGGAYLPLDPGYPEERKRYMLKDSGAKFLLTRQEITGLSSPEAFNTSPKGTPSFGISPRQGGHLAYVIYTSGTTGKPKGALVNHGNVVGLLFNDKTPFDFSEADVWTLFHSSCFDFSVWEMYGALLYGGKLIVISQMTARDPRRFLEVLEKEKVTILNQTPQAFYHLAHLEIQDPGKKLGLRFVIFGGDALKPAQLKSWREKYPRTTLVNMFGITETTVHVTYKEVEPGDIAADISNIGRPLATLTVYIMDRDRKLVPMGTAGEICVGGAGLCRGYLNRPELTREKFVDNPYLKGKLLYRSGDAGKILESGDIEYLGRIDQQVKIRGFRIEPKEIETHLANAARIQEAVVAVKERQGEKYLCAYVVLKEAGALNTAELKKTLSQTLPAYMIPSYFVQIEKIPLTPNGKVDRNALPEPGLEAGEHDIAPRDKLEKQLAEIWSGVLGVKKEIIGIDANFFDLGGHSLKATIVMSKIHRVLEVEVPLLELFNTPTIRQLAQYIKNTKKESKARKHDRLVLLKHDSHQSEPFFLVHDGSGEVEGYIEFCNHLTSRFNVWGIAANRLENYTPRGQSMEEMAQSAIRKIKKIQPQGPYRVAGWSIGGTIAFEMVRQIEQRKEKTGFLGLIDTLPPDNGLPGQSGAFNAETELNLILDYFPGQAIKKRLEKAAKIGMQRIWPELLAHLAENQREFEIDIFKDSLPAPITKIIPNFARLGINRLIYSLNMIRTLDQARNRYLPSGKINTVLHFFKAAGAAVSIDAEKWNRYCRAPVRIVEIPGDHFSITRMPEAAAIARVLADTLSHGA